MSKNLYIVMGLPGSGKSTWLKEHLNDPVIVSRDEVRFSMPGENSKYFDNEKKVFSKYVNTIQEYLDSSNNIDVYADATHINQKSRNKLLNKLNLKDVNINILYINTPVEECIKRNNNREGLEKVSEKVIRDFNERLEVPTHNEKYKYKSIIEVRV